jgi:subtilisin family serine protease
MRGLASRVVDLTIAALLVVPSVVPGGALARPIYGPSTSAATSIVAPSASARVVDPAVPGHILVGMKAGHAAGSLAGKYGLAAASVRSSGRVTMVRVPKGKTPVQLAAEVARDSDVAYASPDYIRQTVSTYTSAPNDPAYKDSTTYQWGSGMVTSYAKSWWERGGGAAISGLWGALGASTYGPRASGADIKVAVLDTGFYMTHPDKGANIVAGKDEFATYNGATGVFTTDGDVTPAPVTAPLNTEDIAAHGTCCAGEIAAGTDNAVGVAGISYDSTVMVYKVAGIWTDGSPAIGYPAGCAVLLDGAIISGIKDATDAGAKIISMSLGGSSYSPAIQSAIDYAYNHGVLVVAASGNSGRNNAVLYPGANDHVVAVGSYELDATGAKTRSSFTDYGVGGDVVDAGARNGQLDVLTPGAGVWGLCDPAYTPTGGVAGYDWWSGTSMATPAFAGMVALVWRFAPKLTNDEIATYMLSSSVAAGTSQPNTAYGWGYASPTATYARLKSDLAYLVAPSVTASTITSRSAVPVRWSTVSGRSVTYDVKVDGSLVVSGTPSLAATVTLSNGSHAVAVTPKSVYNWSSGAATTVTVAVDAVVPTITGLAFDPGTGTISWHHSEEGATYATQYYVDSRAPASLSGTTYDPAVDGIADGPHTFHVQVTDAAGNPSGWASLPFNYLTPPAAPTIGSPSTSPDSTYTLTWGAVPGATSYEVRLNGAAFDNGPALSRSLPLVGGSNTVEVRAVSRDGTSTLYSGWAAMTVVYAVPLPGVPALSVPRDTASPVVTASWPPAAYAASYEYRVTSGGVVGPTVPLGAATSVEVSLPKGDSVIAVRSRNSTGVSAWGPANVTFAPPVPEPPQALPNTFQTTEDRISLSWQPMDGVASYDYRMNAGSIQTTSATSVDFTGLLRGTNTLQVRSRSIYGDTSAWVSVDVRFEPPVIYAIEGAVSTPVRYGSHGVLSASVHPSDGSPPGIVEVAIEQSTDRITWSPFTTAPTTAAGLLAVPIAPTRITYYRLTCVGQSAVVRAGVTPVVGTPSAPSRHDHHAFTVTGSLKPRHTAKAVNIRIKAYLRDRHGHYVLRKIFSMKNANYSSYTRYTGSVALPYNGTWHLYATYSSTTIFDSTRSGYRTVSVR